MPNENVPINCEIPNPMIVYSDTNNPFQIKYQVPYTSKFNLYTSILKEFDQNFFIASNPTTANDEDKFWDEIEKLNASQVKAWLMFFLNNTGYQNFFFSNFELIKSSKSLVVFYDSSADFSSPSNAGSTWISQ
jgi:hypothetical protein